MINIKRFGSLIKVRPEYEERYIILHKHTFPGVLKQISACNISNYSIFLQAGVLFSYYEYTGSDYTADMAKMGEDLITREWWKLTDPMQEPLENREKGEWWTVLPEAANYKAQQAAPENVQRWAYTLEGFNSQAIRIDGIHSYSAFQFKNIFYVYLESESDWEGLPEQRLMPEVFHTD